MHAPSTMSNQRALRFVDIGLFAAFSLVLIHKALLDLDIGWDNLNYHLPFAAMRVGIFGDEFKFSGWLNGFYEGFPPLQNLISGYLWKLTGFVNTANLLNVLIFCLFAVALHCFAGIPLILVAVAIAAIPTIHTQLAGGHVDNLSNIPFALALVATFIAALRDRRDFISLYFVAIAGLAFAANVRLQFVLLSCLAFLPISLFFWIKYVRHAHRRGKIYFAFIFVLGAIALAWLPLRNSILFQNPLYPILLDIYGWHLPGNITSASYTSPNYLAGSPNWLKWFVSVSEYNAFGLRPSLYTIGQGDVPENAMSFRMGGYLFVYVFVSLVLFGYLAWRQPRPLAYWLLAAALALTLAVAVIPSSYELRYFSFWMLALVSCVLCMLWADTDLRQLRFAYASVCIGALWFVASGTGYNTFVTHGYDLSWVMKEVKFDQTVAPQIHPNETYCVLGFGKYVLAVAPRFHPELGPYKVFIAQDQRECGTRPILTPQG